MNIAHLIRRNLQAKEKKNFESEGLKYKTKTNLQKKNYPNQPKPNQLLSQSNGVDYMNHFTPLSSIKDQMFQKKKLTIVSIEQHIRPI